MSSSAVGGTGTDGSSPDSDRVVRAPVQADVEAAARHIASLGSRSRASIYHLSWWSDRILQWAMSHDEFKTQLFRLVDVLPALHTDEDVVDYLEQYLSGVAVPRLIGAGLAISDHLPGGDHLSATVTRHNVEKMARQFIAGSNDVEAALRISELWKKGVAATVDLLGEHTCSDEEAAAYARRARRLLSTLVEDSASWPSDDHLERDDTGPVPRISLSIKVSALTASFTPLTIDRAVDEAESRLIPIITSVPSGAASFYLDMESYETKEIIRSLFRRLLANPRLEPHHLGIVVQAYLLDSFEDLEEIAELSRSRANRVAVRLVKGAYWDTESIIAASQGWPGVVFGEKDETDANFERCALYLLDRRSEIRPAFASHNLRSIAYVIAAARSAGLAGSAYEIQLLYGMAEPVQVALRSMGARLRVYSPVGDLVPGMSYLVRRLLENTSNESFVRHRFAEGRSLAVLLRPPSPKSPPRTGSPEGDPFRRSLATDALAPSPYVPEPLLQWRRHGVRATMHGAVEAVAFRFGRRIPILVDGHVADSGTLLDSVDPSDPDVVVARSELAGPDDVVAALETARRAAKSWSSVRAGARAGILFRAAQWMRVRRIELAALQVFEVGKPWADADADVCEAIDYLEYYGREALRLSEGGPVDSPPGESNRLDYEARGVAAVISPWNFPLAIPTGMVAGALAAGNVVVLKPAEQSPACAFALVEALLAGGLPPAALSFLPGAGETVGAQLVSHPDVDVIAFTGSREVGLSIVEAAGVQRAGQRSVKKVVAEMGGKNALVIDADADLDEAVLSVIRSAFGYSGQKCSAASRVIVLDPVYDTVADRIVGAARTLSVGHPRRMGTHMGPLIDAAAVDRVDQYRREPGGTMLLDRDDVPDRGYFCGPLVVGDVDPRSPTARDEIFGPVLALFRAADLDTAIELANDTDFALTAGIISRSPRNIRRAASDLRAGNVYINRPITGAVVGRQPFGGSGLSGVGSKAGGPDYVAQFTNPRVVCENTVRHGFAPDPRAAQKGST